MFITVSLYLRVTATGLRCHLVCLLNKCPTPQCFVARSHPGTVGSPACSNNDVMFTHLGGLLTVLSTFVVYQHTSPCRSSCNIFILKIHNRLHISHCRNNSFHGYLYYLDLTRLPSQTQVPDGKWTRKPLAYRESNNLNFIVYV